MNVEETQEALISLGYSPDISDAFICNEINQRKEEEKNRLLRMMFATSRDIDDGKLRIK